MNDDKEIKLKVTELRRITKAEYADAKSKKSTPSRARASFDLIILRQALIMAIRNDASLLKSHFEDDLIEEIVSDVGAHVEVVADILLERDGAAIMYFADFARAFWGSDLPHPGGMLTRHFLEENPQEDKTITHTQFVWQYHLFRMAREMNPLGYIQKFLIERPV